MQLKRKYNKKSDRGGVRSFLVDICPRVDILRADISLTPINYHLLFFSITYTIIQLRKLINQILPQDNVLFLKFQPF